MRPCQGQQAGDAEGQLEGGFPFAGRSRRDDDAMILRNLAQSGDQEFPADDENGNPGGAEPFARQVNEGGGDGYFIRQGVNQLAEGGDLIQAAGQVAVQPVRAGSQNERDQRSQVSPGIPVRDADCCRKDDYQGNTRQGNGIGQVQHTGLLGDRWLPVASFFAGFRNEISGKRRTEKSEGNTKIRATGRMMRAFQFLLPVSAVLRQLIPDHFVEVFLGNDGHAQFEGLVPLGASSAACQEAGGGFGDGSGGFPP